MVSAPNVMPCTMPPAIVALPLLALHTPAEMASVSVTESPAQIFEGPKIVPEPSPSTVTIWVLTAVTQALPLYRK